jgi:uncharacterized protein YkwD
LFWGRDLSLHHRVIRTAISASLSAGLALGIAAGAPAHAGTRSAGRAVVQELIGLINKDRAAHHRKPLTLDSAQSQCSLRHTKHMAAQDFISHDDFPSDVCTPHVWVGENVGVAPGDPVSGAAELEQMMMAEGPCPDAGCPHGEFEQHGHYLNLTSKRFTRVGIGAYISGGQVWITEDFTGGK